MIKKYLANLRQEISEVYFQRYYHDLYEKYQRYTNSKDKKDIYCSKFERTSIFEKLRKKILVINLNCFKLTTDSTFSYKF